MTEEHRPFCTPAMATLIVGAATLLISGSAAVIYTPLRSGLDAVTKDLAEMRADPKPKPETRVEMEALKGRMEALEQRENRLDERLNGLHFYIMQNPPRQPSNSPFSRRGDAVIPPLFEPERKEN